MLFIEFIAQDLVLRKHLHPGEKPEKEFTINFGIQEVRAYCNVHGLWVYKP